MSVKEGEMPVKEFWVIKREFQFQLSLVLAVYKLRQKNSMKRTSSLHFIGEFFEALIPNLLEISYEI